MGCWERGIDYDYECSWVVSSIFTLVEVFLAKEIETVFSVSAWRFT
jgi:hypothetical protein